jgi:hypothetical protein
MIEKLIISIFLTLGSIFFGCVGYEYGKAIKLLKGDLSGQIMFVAISVSQSLIAIILGLFAIGVLFG